MGILVLNGNRIVLNGATISLGGPDPTPDPDAPKVIMAVSVGRMMAK